MIKFPLVDNATTTNNPQLCSCCQQALTQQDDEVWLMLGALQGSNQLQHSDSSGQLFAFFRCNNAAVPVLMWCTMV